MAGSPLRPGDPEFVGPYRILARLGQGGQGVVYLGRHRDQGDDGERVAVKMLHSTHAQRPESRARFLREIEVARQIAEFCTARVLDVGESGDALYVVSEFIEGVSLQKSVEEDGPRRGSRCSGSRWARSPRWPPSTRRASCTATSSRTTCCSAPTGHA
ncbi:protein kinase domain-containing protein [Thermocatellispora tengchongensis]|uniref:protein kinase domain-containing protein n=1 Tax=Thermocatellispora tengchongensis TaxID=1073253 RepID=UPI0036334E7B